MSKVFRFRFLGIVMFLGMIAVFSVAVMFLWNILMPEIFGLSALSYWQAAGLVILARILFGGLGPGHFGSYRGRGNGLGRGGCDHGNPFREKWMNMTDDERVEFVRTHRGFRNHPAFFGENDNEKKPVNE
jgi:hypothetical protein